MQQQDHLNLFETQLDETAKAHLLETTRWTKFIGICYTIMVVLFIAYFIFMMSFLGAAGGAAMYSATASFFVVMLTVVLNIYPVYALLKFSSSMKKGIQLNNQELINEGFRYQKTMFRYIGILIIIYLSLVLLLILFGGLSAAFR